MKHTVPSAISANPAWKIAIVYASFYGEEIGAMVASAKKALLSAGISEENIAVHSVYGSFEIPLLGAAIAERGIADAILGLGIIVEGETEHARLIAEAATQGIMNVQTMYRVPFAFEILLVDTLQYAADRTDKGAEAAQAALVALHALDAL